MLSCAKTLRLPAGHAMLVEANGKVQINPWWNTLDHLPEPPARFEEQVEEFRALFLTLADCSFAVMYRSRPR
jgi:hypothetical protein